MTIDIMKNASFLWRETSNVTDIGIIHCKWSTVVVFRNAVQGTVELQTSIGGKLFSNGYRRYWSRTKCADLAEEFSRLAGKIFQQTNEDFQIKQELKRGIF